MILIYKNGIVKKVDVEIDCPRFRLPVQTPAECTWVKEGDMVYIDRPVFKYLEFEYVTTVDDDRIFKEVMYDET
jgi:hypothetical protein